MLLAEVTISSWDDDAPPRSTFLRWPDAVTAAHRLAVLSGLRHRVSRDGRRWAVAVVEPGRRV